jgi:hypothetical protein
MSWCVCQVSTSISGKPVSWMGPEDTHKVIPVAKVTHTQTQRQGLCVYKDEDTS